MMQATFKSQQKVLKAQATRRRLKDALLNVPVQTAVVILAADTSHLPAGLALAMTNIVMVCGARIPLTVLILAVASTDTM